MTTRRTCAGCPNNVCQCRECRGNEEEGEWRQCPGCRWNDSDLHCTYFERLEDY